jgi:hypothetical protein
MHEAFTNDWHTHAELTQTSDIHPCIEGLTYLYRTTHYPLPTANSRGRV